MSSENIYSIFKVSSLTKFIMLIVVSFAAATGASASNITDEIRVLVEENTANLMSKLEQEKSSYATDPEHFYQEMDTALSELVAFRRIAGRVMGKHARAATKEQRNRFLIVFKRSMYETYSKALVESNVAAMDVTMVRLNTRSNKKATVTIKVQSGTGNHYDVAYSVYNNKSGIWKVENVVVSGINVGLAFRDRFNQAYNDNRGDIDAVIERWSTGIEDDVSHAVAIK